MAKQKVEQTEHLDCLSNLSKELIKEIRPMTIVEAADRLKDQVVEEAVQIKMGFKVSLTDLTVVTSAYVEYRKAAKREKAASLQDGEEDFM